MNRVIEKKLRISISESSCLLSEHLFGFLFFVVEVEEAEEVAVVGLGDDTDVITQQDLLQELLGQVLHTTKEKAS